MNQRRQRMIRVAVLTCSELGYETARALARLPEAEVVAVIEAPPRRPNVRRRFRTLWKRQGLPGLLRWVGRQVKSRLPNGPAAAEPTTIGLPEGVRRIECEDFHSDRCVELIGQLDLDLAVVDGTYILRESVFSLPKEGSINLHCGKLPEFRGAPPAFWELLQGEEEVGVTIHRVSAELDQGPILKQELVPLDPAPSTDPMEYIDRLWRDSLRPAGIRIIGEVIRDMARGELVENPQDVAAGSTFRFPDYATVRELRHRVRERRRMGRR